MDIPFQYEIARLRTLVTALKAGCDVSSSFFAADKYCRSAPNASAACDFCSWVNVLRTPSQVIANRTAAIVARSRPAAPPSAAALGGSSNSGMQSLHKHE